MACTFQVKNSAKYFFPKGQDPFWPKLAFSGPILHENPLKNHNIFLLGLVIKSDQYINKPRLHKPNKTIVPLVAYMEMAGVDFTDFTDAYFC